jgi:hypothetical protein
MRKVLFFSIIMILALTGCATNLNQYIIDHVQGSCDKATITTDWGPVFSAKIDLEKVKITDTEVSAKVLDYGRTGNVGSTHIHIEGYRAGIKNKK